MWEYMYGRDAVDAAQPDNHFYIHYTCMHSVQRNGIEGTQNVKINRIQANNRQQGILGKSILHHHQLCWRLSTFIHALVKVVKPEKRKEEKDKEKEKKRKKEMKSIA